MLHFRWISRCFRWLMPLGLALVLGLAMGWVGGLPGLAQLDVPDPLSQSNSSFPPLDVQRFGNLETMAVQSPLSRTPLFTIASLTTYDRSAESLGQQQAVERRAEEVRARLLLLLRRPMDPETLVFDIAELNDLTIIRARDAGYPHPLVLLSVTDLDADFNGQPVAELAESWRQMLEQELRAGLQELPQNRRRVTRTLVWLVLLTIAALGAKSGVSARQGQLRRRKQWLSQQKEKNAPSPETDGDNLQVQRRRFLRRLEQILSVDRQLWLLDFAQWALFWLVVLAWYLSVGWLYTISPFLLQYNFAIVDRALQLFGIWFFVGLFTRLGHRLTDRLTTSWSGPDLTDIIALGDAQRRQLRASTIAGATKGLITVVVLIFGLLSALGVVGLPIGSVVAIFSVVALAVSFGSRRLVEDLVNGFLILAEDQFAIGDVIDVGHAAGLVETLNLRVTQLRSADGELVTLPNSNITEVKNLTRSWSRVNFSIDVAYHTDPDLALSVVKQVAEDLYRDADWHSRIMETPDVLGIDHVSHSGITITTWIKTAPAQQWAVGREFRLRVRRAFADHRIEIGTPRQTYALESSELPRLGQQGPL